MENKKWKKKVGIFHVVIVLIITGMEILAKKKGDSVYDNEPEQKNPFAGKKVVFVEDESNQENADGRKGHLEIVGDSLYCSGFYEKYIKRIFDLFLSGIGLIVLFPIYAVIAFAIKIEDPGPVLFIQKRMGRNKEYFKLHKFRSMKESTPHDIPTHMLENPDQYITKVGKFLRAHSLDELPQIWDIFIGNMSIIGPRPGLWNQDVLIAEREKYNANDIKPGLTGWAQINGRDQLEIPDKAKLDGEYVRKISLLFDIRCFFSSLRVFGKDEFVVEGKAGALDQAEKRVDWRNYVVDSSVKVSVITPAYNAEKYLEETIQSVRNQTYPNWEMIIIDDCSNDRTLEIAEECSREEERIKIIRQKYNMGAAFARNRGLDIATGKYIAFLDSDDLWLPEKLEKQLRFMEANDYVLTYTAYQKFNPETGEKNKIIRAPAKMTGKKIYGDTSIGCLTVMVNRERSGNFHMPVRDHTEDNITWQNILDRGGYTGYLLDEVLSQYREGNLSLTSSKINAAKQQWKTYREFYEFSVPRSAVYFIKYACNIVKRKFN